MKHYTFLDLGKVNRHYEAEIKAAVNRVIESGRYIGGQEVECFEQSLATICRTSCAVGVSNGLDALRLIFRAYIEMGVMQPGDEVIVPSDTYIASILAVTDNGLQPVFVEPDLATYNLDYNLIEQAITAKTRAILPVHLYGRVCWDEKLVEVARKYNLKIIEDNAQAIGATALVDGLSGTRTTGGLGDAAGISFYPTKNVGALGDAGAVVTQDEQLAQMVRSLRNYGSSVLYQNDYAGLNCRLDPMQAAILNVKLPYLEQENTHRQQLADVYEQTINNALVVKPLARIANEQVWHQYVVRVENREAFRVYLAERGVETGIHYPVAPHRQPCYAQYSHLHLPIAEQIAAQVVSLPITRCTTHTDATEIASIINDYQG